jgi:HEAT repeat protein
MQSRALVVAGALAAAAAAGPEPGPGDVSEAQAKTAILRFAEEYDAEEVQARRGAIERLGATVHPLVAQRLLRTLRRQKDPALVIALCRGLALQRSSAQVAGEGVARFLVEAAEVEAKALARGDFGVPTDPRTNDAVLDTPDARQRLAESQARGEARTEALRCLETLGYYEPADVKPLSVFLQSPHDGLVVGVLGAFGRWRAWHALPAMLELYRMYPSPSRWETGSVVDRGGTNATAKAAWNAKFGHPNKQRPRPEVVKALTEALAAITGETFKAPADLAEYLRRPDVEANMVRSSRRQAPLADARKAVRDAQRALRGTSFETIAPEERDRLFLELARHDHPDAIPPLAEAVGRFSGHVDAIEARILAIREVLRPLEEKRGLSPADAARREDAEAELAAWTDRLRTARATLDLIADALGRFQDQATLERALALLPKHACWRVRCLFADGAARWYARQPEAGVPAKCLPALAGQAKDPNPLVRVAAARALGASRQPEAVEHLRAIAAGDADWRARAAAVLGLGDTGSPEAISALIEAMRSAEGRLLDDINATLLRITGWNLVYPEVWAQWWKDARGQVPDPPEAAPPAETALREAHLFYGIPTRTKRVLYVIDISGSMTRSAGHAARPDRSVGVGDRASRNRTRLDVAQDELKRAIGELSADANFSIIFFNHSVQVWDRELQKATPEIRRAARDAVMAARPSGATFTLGALREAFAVAGVLGAEGGAKSGGALVDTIFLLSDGAPTDAKLDDARLMDPSIILEAVRCWNRGHGIVIHTIAIDVQDSRFLRELAADNGGQFAERKG